MGFFIAAGVIAFIAFTLFIIGFSLGRQGSSFEKNKRMGQAEVVGYERGERSNWYTLLVRIPELNDGKIYNCTAGKMNISQYPKGSVIDVLYAPKKVAGINVVEVHLLSNPPADSSKVGRGIKKFSVAMLAIAVMLVVAGIVTIL